MKSFDLYKDFILKCSYANNIIYLNSYLENSRLPFKILGKELRQDQKVLETYKDCKDYCRKRTTICSDIYKDFDDWWYNIYESKNPI